jgi:hypothetical protein
MENCQCLPIVRAVWAYEERRKICFNSHAVPYIIVYESVSASSLSHTRRAKMYGSALRSTFKQSHRDHAGNFWSFRVVLCCEGREFELLEKSSELRFR